MSLLQFGVPLYGASMQGELKFVSSNSNGCGAFHDEFKSELTSFVALVERGGRLCFSGETVIVMIFSADAIYCNPQRGFFLKMIMAKVRVEWDASSIVPMK